MISMSRHNLMLNVANLVNIAICLGIMVYCLVKNSFESEDMAYQIQTGFCIIYLGIWSFALCSLFKNFRGSERLLPKKRLFINHAILLSVYLLASILYNLAELFPLWMGSACDDTCNYEWYSNHSLAGVVKSVVETSMFVYVIYQQIPFTNKQNDQTAMLKKVLLQGYATVDDIETAVLEQHSQASEE